MIFSPSSDGASSWVWPHRDLHHELPRGEDDLRALRAGPEDLPEPQGEVRGEEHRPGLRVREGSGGAVQTRGRASFVTGRVRRRTLPRGQLLPLMRWSISCTSAAGSLNVMFKLVFAGCWENTGHEWIRRASRSSDENRGLLFSITLSIIDGGRVGDFPLNPTLNSTRTDLELFRCFLLDLLNNAICFVAHVILKRSVIIKS